MLIIKISTYLEKKKVFPEFHSEEKSCKNPIDSYRRKSGRAVLGNPNWFLNNVAQHLHVLIYGRICMHAGSHLITRNLPIIHLTYQHLEIILETVLGTLAFLNQGFKLK